MLSAARNSKRSPDTGHPWSKKKVKLVAGAAEQRCAKGAVVAREEVQSPPRNQNKKAAMLMHRGLRILVAGARNMLYLDFCWAAA